MVQENELIALLLSLGALIIGLYNYRRIREIEGTWLLGFAFVCFVLSTILTVLEGFFWEAGMNLLEHLFYLVSACLLVAWLWRTLVWQEQEA